MLNLDEERFLAIRSGAVARSIWRCRRSLSSPARFTRAPLDRRHPVPVRDDQEKRRGARLLQAAGHHGHHLTGHADTPLAREADVNFTNHAADDTSSESATPIPCGPSATSSAASGSTRSSLPPCRRASPAGWGWTCPTACSAASTCRSPTSSARPAGAPEGRPGAVSRAGRRRRGRAAMRPRTPPGALRTSGRRSCGARRRTRTSRAACPRR